MAKLFLLFGVHNHQPVGNFDGVFLKAYKECYLPFFQVFSRYPKLKCNVHISGVLWDWIYENNQHELIDLLKQLKAKGQIEFLSGGYYEPILPIIPHRDRVNQIKVMNDFLREEFKEKPQGLWLAERIWEPQLPVSIREAGLEFALVDDNHFKYAGFLAEDIEGFFHTEDEAKPIYLFPISKRLRYKIPFSPIEESYKILKDLCKKFPGGLFTIVDDGEKFGLWPYTYDWVYRRGWLKKFFSLLEENSSWIETLTFSEAREKFSSKGIIYLPTCSYEEMMEWVLEPYSFVIYEEIKKSLSKLNPWAKVFLRGGFFKNFFRKYPRINYMHKKMLYLSKKINENFDFEKDRKIFQDLFKAQCNCAYWHGIFGGFYLPHLREAIYENLIRAEKKVDEGLGETLNSEKVDLDLDGKEEILIKNEHFILEISPHRGGRIEELSLREFEFNLINTLTRREENYHRRVVEEKSSSSLETPSTIHDLVLKKEKGLEKFLIYDRYEKVSLIEHLMDKEKELEESLDSSVFFAEEPYDFNLKEASDKIKLELVNKRKDLSIKKSLMLKKREPEVGIFYEIDFVDRNILQNKNFAVEFNLFILSIEDSFFVIDKEKKFSPKDKVYKRACSFLEIVEGFKQFSLKFEFENLAVFISPLYSVSSSEAGFERNFQQLSLFFINDLAVKKEFSINLRVSKL